MCPYFCIVSRMQLSVGHFIRNALLDLKRAFPYVEKSLSLHQRNAPFVLRIPFPNLLPLGTPLPSEGLGEAFPYGEGAGVRLLYYNTGVVTPDRDDCFVSLSCSKITMSFLPLLR